jgi:hypothetical protein
MLRVNRESDTQRLIVKRLSGVHYLSYLCKALRPVPLVPFWVGISTQRYNSSRSIDLEATFSGLVKTTVLKVLTVTLYILSGAVTRSTSTNCGRHPRYTPCEHVPSSYFSSNEIRISPPLSLKIELEIII